MGNKANSFNKFSIGLLSVNSEFNILCCNQYLTNIIYAEDNSTIKNTNLFDFLIESEELKSTLEAFVNSEADNFIAKFHLKALNTEKIFVNGTFNKARGENNCLEIFIALTPIHESLSAPEIENPTFNSTHHHRRTKKKLRQLYDVMEATNSTIWEYDFSSKAIDLENGFFKLLRLESSPSKDLLDYLKILVHPNDETILSQSIFNLISSNEVQTFTARFRNAEGEWRWLQVSGKITEKQKNGTPKLAQGIVLDITKQKILENELIDSSSTLGAVSALAGTATFEIDLYSGRMIWSNGANNIFDVEKSWRPLDFENFLHAFFDFEAADGLRQAVDNLLFSNCDFKIELPIKSGKNNNKWIEFIGFPREQNGEVTTLIGAFRDISEKVSDSLALAEAVMAAKQASETKSQFLANMSHEIRTPLNGVLGIASALERTQLDANQANMVDIIISSGKTLASLLNDILDLSKIEAGQMNLEVLEVSPYEIINNTAVLFEQSATMKGLRFIVENQIPQNMRIMADGVRLRQIMSNIIGNAVKFTSKGRIEIKTSLQKYPIGNRARFLFNVVDTGTGFSLKVREKLFGRFTQADETTSRNFGGTGLGLSICRSLADLMGGLVDCSSIEGQGSSFWLDCEFEYKEVKLFDEINKITDESQIDGNYTILAVEDNMVNQTVLRLLLQEFPFELIFANNGKEAIEALEERAFDLILMDTQMPIMDGLEATRRIRMLEKSRNKIRTPIITLSANVMKEQLDAARNAGADDYVAKPIDAQELFTKIAAWLEKESDDSANSQYKINF